MSFRFLLLSNRNATFSEETGFIKEKYHEKNYLSFFPYFSYKLSYRKGADISFSCLFLYACYMNQKME